MDQSGNNLKSLKGVGEKTAELLNKLGIFSIEDLIFYYPRKFDLYMEPVKIENADVGKVSSIEGSFISRPSIIRKGRFNIVTGVFSDNSNMINVKWFNAPYMASNITPGKKIILRGLVTVFGKQKSINHPQIFDIQNYEVLSNKLFPIYPLTKGLSNKVVAGAIKDIFDNNKYTGLTEYLPEKLLKNKNLKDYPYAVKHIHFPENEEDFNNARNRLVYDEFLVYSLALLKLTDSFKNVKSSFEYNDDKVEDIIIKSLPYELTKSQKNAIKDIFNDFYNKKLMNRLLEGDVGSGKTIIAFIAMIKTAASSYQSALMAPTETLAVQHYNNLSNLLKISKLDSKFNICLLKSKLKASERKKILEDIASGQISMIIGTHALFSEDVIYKNLALVVTDEQHRFGVKQRSALEDKNITSKPNSLIMSATPIPRTLALLLYADLDISVLSEKPKGRLSILNAVTNVEHRKDVYKFVQKEIDKGHQAFFICSSIEKDEDDEFSDLENVKDYAKMLKNEFKDSVKIGIMHGKMKSEEKDKIMTLFKNKEIDILVATTVIEVGIDIENATVMVVEDADRFGLSTLHQLRGRVGRGNDQSYAIFVSKNTSENSQKRLSIILHSNDGFKIADEDLKMRGPGEFFGERQSGIQIFNLANTYKDYDIFKLASSDAGEILKEDKMLTHKDNLGIASKLDGYIKKRYTL